MLRRRLMNSRKEEELSYTDKYLTIEALEDGVTVTFTNNGLEYCVDGDGNWMPLYEFEEVIIDTGHTLHFRGNLVPDEYYGVGKFHVDNEFNLKGNVMSILYGDDGYLNYSLSGKENAFCELFYLAKGLKSVSPNFLPATTLSAYCYYSMFDGCTKLEKAPDLPAEELVTLCYSNMFYGCERLNYIKALFKTTPSDEYTDYWVSGVSQSGIFVKHPEATWNVVGINGVPEGWTVKFDGDQESESPYDFSFDIITTDGVYEANAEDLAILNKGLEIIMQIAGGNLGGFEFSHETAPPEFDLRINGTRNFIFSFFEYSTNYTAYFSFFDDINYYFGMAHIQKSNPVFETFILYTA